MPRSIFSYVWISLAACCALSACGGDSNAPPIAQPLTATIEEDATLIAQLRASDPNGDVLRAYLIVNTDPNATIVVDSSSGTLTVKPAANFNGHVHATYTVSDRSSTSVPALIDIDIRPVNDPPAITDIGPQIDSADTYPTHIPVDPGDVDGDVTQWNAESADPTVAEVSVDATTHTLQVVPHRSGSTTITVTVGDGQYDSTVSFPFVVGPRTTTRSLTMQSAAVQATSVAEAPTHLYPHLVVSNTTQHLIHFDLDVNEALEPGTADDVIARAAAAVDAFPGEPLPYKIAREIARVMGRGYTLTEKTWIHEPMTAMNSIGFGYCDDVASAFAYLARRAGFDARVWTLGGHVVPEVNIDGQWVMLDPDLGVYYSGTNGSRALGVVELEADPGAITDPASLHYLAHKSDVAPSSAELADIYATVNNNMAWDYYDAPVTLRSLDFDLPAGASLDFRKEDVTDWIDVAGAAIPTRSTVTLHLPAGYTGSLPPALVLADAHGDGRLQIGGSDLAIGSTELLALLSTFDHPRNGVIITNANSALDLVFYINPAATDYSAGARVHLRGTLIGGLATELRQ